MFPIGTGLEPGSEPKYQKEWRRYLAFCSQRGMRKIPGRDCGWQKPVVANATVLYLRKYPADRLDLVCQRSKTDEVSDRSEPPAAIPSRHLVDSSSQAERQVAPPFLYVFRRRIGFQTRADWKYHASPCMRESE